MPLRAVRLAAVLSVLALASGCAPGAGDDASDGAAAVSEEARSIDAMAGETAGYLDRLVAVHAVGLDRGAARAYELLGGDGANAMRLAVAVDAPSGETSFWMLDLLMFRSVEKVEPLGERGLRIEILRDTIELDGETQGTERLELELGWTAEGAGLGRDLQLAEGPLAPEKIARSDDAASALLGRVLGVAIGRDDDTAVVAAAVRRPGGGATVLLSIGDGYGSSEAFDLGLHVDGVASVASAGPGKLRVTSTVTDETGRLPTTTHEVAFTKATDGIARTVRVSPTR